MTVEFMKTAEAATNLVEILTPFSSEERTRIVQAALTLLGDSPVPLSGASKSVQNSSLDSNTGLPPKAAAWLRQNSLDQAMLDHVFHIEGDTVELIAPSIPGKSDKERSLNIYLLTGAARLIATGEASFDDKAARSACKHLGCYNDANHSNYLKDKGNRFAGSKDQGWKITAPGLMCAASLIKEMTKG